MRQPNFVRLETVGQFEEFNLGELETEGEHGRTRESMGQHGIC